MNPLASCAIGWLSSIAKFKARKAKREVSPGTMICVSGHYRELSRERDLTSFATAPPESLERRMLIRKQPDSEPVRRFIHLQET
ncbi:MULTISPECIES: hypothetical protein [Cupriavidus]|uniref:Uncharacterized protein n=1 Tax=Cupriavidus oxalaticus TaxID=96344 RepID=A0A4V1BYX1_9BURK|nr:MULTISPECIES: hypothetical protein [Cupriavidus]MBF6987531.1 hypothetical protein [Cupriavidus sp. IK-TO18]QBY53302.1 hypothetical protein E0W60_19615 [Cupriavidus oxalaticus]